MLGVLNRNNNFSIPAHTSLIDTGVFSSRSIIAASMKQSKFYLQDVCDIESQYEDNEIQIREQRSRVILYDKAAQTSSIK